MSTEPKPAQAIAAIDLVSRIQSGDAGAEEALVLQYQRAVIAIARIRTHDATAAFDIAQDVFMAVLKAIREGSIREPEHLSAFIQGTTRNLVNNYLRTRTRRAESALDDVEEPRIDPIPNLESSERWSLVRNEVAKFSRMDQQILLMSLVDGLSLAVIAQRLEISHDVARARKSRMVRKIIERFEAVSQKSLEPPSQNRSLRPPQ